MIGLMLIFLCRYLTCARKLTGSQLNLLLSWTLVWRWRR